MPNAEISLPPGAQLGYTIAVASGEFELALDGTVIARVDRPLSDEERWHVSQLKPGIHRLDLTARNLGAERGKTPGGRRGGGGAGGPPPPPHRDPPPPPGGAGGPVSAGGGGGTPPPTPAPQRYTA